jgi:hypothetical protein
VLEVDKKWAPDFVFPGQNRFPRNLLNTNPVDLLTVERGFMTRPPTTYEASAWENLLSSTLCENRPELVIETWPSYAQLWSKGPACKSTVARWEDLGYASRFR